MNPKKLLVAQDVQRLKAEANHAKSELIRILNKMETKSPKQAKRLDNIICRLEYWQNS